MSLHSTVKNRPKPVTTNGFTLMEMLIVIAIMLLLVIATLPRIKYALDESKVREASRQLSSYISLAKSRAASSGRACGVFLQVEALGTGGRQCTQLYLAETPPAYSGDVLEDQVYVVNSMQSPSEFDPNGANYDENYRGTWWQVTFPNSSSLPVLLANDTPPYPKFKLQFDFKGPFFNGIFYNSNFYVIGPRSPDDPATPPANRILPPGAGYPSASRKYQIVRRPRRIGAPLALPRGTAIDLNYSGMGNSGINFNGANPYALVMFNPTGPIESVSSGGNLFDPQGTIHFLVGRPEKVLNNVSPFAANTNIVDHNALWVSIGRLTGSVTTTENAYTDNPTLLPNNPTFFDYLTKCREFAITQDVKGGQ